MGVIVSQHKDPYKQISIMDFSLEACKFLVPVDISSLGMCTKDRCEQLGNQNITSIEREDSSWNQHFRTWKWMVDGWKTGCPLKKMVPWNCWWNKSILKFHGLFQKTMTMTILWSTWTPRVCLMTTFVHEPLINQFPSWNQICCTSELSDMFAILLMEAIRLTCWGW